MISAAREEWDHDVSVYMVQAEKFRLKPRRDKDESATLKIKIDNHKQGKGVFQMLKEWLGTNRPSSSSKQLQRQRACLQSTNEMSDSRTSGPLKPLLDLLNYTAALAAFIHIEKGNYNNRTGHSIAYGMLSYRLIASVLLCSLIRGHATKWLSEDVSKQLCPRFEAIEVKYSIHEESRESIPSISRLCSSDI